jgi:hypothetical protein
MTTQSYTSSSALSSSEPNTDTRQALLRRVLYGNVAFSVLSAGVFFFAGEQIATFLGIADILIFDLINGVSFISLMSIGLALFAIDVLFVATRNPINLKYAWMIAVADFIWVALSWLLLATGVIAFSDAGNWAVLIIADIVLLFGIAEVVGIRRITR